MKTTTLTVRATRDFRVGPFGRFLVVAKNETRTIQADSSGTFWTTTNEGHAFGSCRVGEGWEITKGKLPFSWRRLWRDYLRPGFVVRSLR